MLRVPKALLGLTLVLLLFAAGLALRLYDLDDPPLDFHPVRQIHSALIARGMYQQSRAELPDWQRAMAVQQWHSEGRIEPLIMESLAVWGYRLAGGTHLWIPRLWAIAFWMVGALFVFLLTRDLIGQAGAVLALWFFLIWPYGVIASRSFQPEPLFMALIAAALWAALRWEASSRQPATAGPPSLPEEGGTRAIAAWALLTGLLAGMAIYVKLVAVFFVGPVLAVLVLSRGWHAISPRSWRRSWPVWGMAALTVLPYSLYHIDGMYVSGFLREQFSQRFFPQMWIEPAFYLRWISEMSRVIPFELVVVAALAVLLVRHPLHRAALIALWAGYLAYGLALPHHIGTHDYYHLPLFIPVALGLGALAELVYRHLRGPAGLTRLAAVVALLSALLITGYGARNTLKRSDFRAEAVQWQQVGAWLGPQANTVALVDDYGSRLKYWGWVMPLIWPTADDLRWQVENGGGEDFGALFDRIAAGQDFFVVSPLAELERQPELAQELARHPIAYQANDVLIYDLRPASGP